MCCLSVVDASDEIETWVEEITRGDLLIGGQRMNDVDASRRGIAMVFQSYALYPHMTVRENLRFALKFAGVPVPEIRARVEEATMLADKIVVLRDGRVEQVGSPLQLCDDPDNLFVAGFIGSPRMNLLPATRLGERLVLREFDGQSVYLPRLGTPPAEGEEVTVGIRPTAFRTSGEEGLSMTAEIVEHLGAETLVHARPRGSSRLVTIQREDARDVVAGQPIDVRFGSDSVLLFGRDGRRVR